MNKKFRTIMSKIILGASLGVITATTAIPTTSAYAVYNQDNLSMQTIYRENGYIVAQVNAAPRVINTTYMSCFSDNVKDSFTYDTGYSNPNTHYDNYYYDTNTETKYYDDGTIVTISENGDKYLITFKIPESLFEDLSSARGFFETECLGGQQRESYQDSNNGHGYRL